MALPETLLQGRPEPFGSLARDGGVNFALWSEHAERIELCVFDAQGRAERKRYALHGPHEGVFHGFLPDAGPGCVYGYRAHGPHVPEQGHRFDPDAVLLDPYAQEIVGLKARVASPAEPRHRPAAPRVEPQDVVLYEVHVKGFSALHPRVPSELCGRYAGLAHPAAIEHFRSLGVTTLCLLPVQYHLDEPALAAAGRVNYWGYNTLGFFSPDPRFAQQPHNPTAVNAEFRAMVDALHAAGLQVVLDVVYNHTPEGNEHGPTLSFRGIDNATWYRLDPQDRRRCENLTGCGNTVNIEHPRVARFVIDSLRYWIEEMGVDGFRFDLAPVLGRTAAGFDAHAPFFRLLRDDPVLSRVHLIAEPWDAGPEGYCLGRFPGRFMEWNDRFRDAVRGYWLGTGVAPGEFARRFAASSDVFQQDDRQPAASVNFLTAHDGFTLADVVSHERKHNEANGEGNRDGRDGELCASFGPEGPSDDAAVRDTRERVRRAMLATLALAQGTPMLLAGDEIGHTQQGNNNAYCQDNEISWLGWAQADESLADFVSRLLALRRTEPPLRHPRWFEAEPSKGEAVLCWTTPEGRTMAREDWDATARPAFACEFLAADPAAARLLVLFNPQPVEQAFCLPPGAWALLLDSSGAITPQQAPWVGCFDAPARTLSLLRSGNRSSS